MSVPAEVSHGEVRRQLEDAGAFAQAAGLVVNSEQLSATNLRFVVTFKNAQGERFCAEFDCRDFPLAPPTIEFVSSDQAERGSARLYPSGFHAMPCVCMRYNRKAYQERGGPHQDWRLIDWQLPTAQGVGINSLALIFSDLHAKIRSSSGRMG